MVTFPNAKINLGLYILSERPDGYHNIHSCFYPVPFADVLEIVTSEQFEFKSSGLSIPGSGNLCIQAFEMLKTNHGIGNVKIHLHKVIPIGAGLGGGSANATFALYMLNEIFNLNLQTEALETYAARLGSDCPFFVRNIPVIASDTGTTLKPLDISLKGMYLALISPGIHVSTAQAYSGVSPTSADNNLQNLLKQPVMKWRNELINDFEKSVFPQHPKIKHIKTQLYGLGALYSSMTGSGSAVYALFENEVDLSTLKGQLSSSGYLD